MRSLKECFAHRAEWNRLRLSLILFVLLGGLPPVIGNSSDAERVGLVMGNSTYPNWPLTNPVNDAADVAASLLAELARPNQSLAHRLTHVDWAVASATKNQQEPWYPTSPLPRVTLAQWNDPSASTDARLTPPVAPVVTPVPVPKPAPTTRQAGDIFRDRLADGSEGPSMVVIPTGSFQMGSPKGETDWDSSTSQHKVIIETAFALGQHEVTVGEFRRFVEATNYQTDAERNFDGEKGCFVTYREGNTWEVGYRAGASWKNPNFKQGDDHPVVCISWNDAIAYTVWLSTQTEQRYRLPTAAEWEYAARAGTMTARYWGDDPNQACHYANVADHTMEKTFHDRMTIHDCTDHQVYTAPVGAYQPNRWKLHDLLGNVWEWTCSVYQKSYNGSEKECTEKATPDPLAVRGGGWCAEATSVDAAERNRATATGRSNFLGFRVARSL